MNQLTLEFSDWNDLQTQLTDITQGIADKPGAALVSVNHRPDGSGQMSLALFNDQELADELARRTGKDAPAPEADKAETPKRGPGRPRKPTLVPPVAPPAEAAAEQPPAAEAVPAKASEPNKSAESVAPDLPTEDSMLELMSEVYSASGDMELVRGIMKEVGEQTQLSRIPVALWPALHARLVNALVKVKANAS